MIIENGTVLMSDWTFANVDLRIDDGKITEIAERGRLRRGSGNGSENEIEADYGQVIDASGLRVIPGLFDIHIHGCASHDFCDGTPEAVDGIANYLAGRGVTSFLATSMALPEKQLTGIFANGARAIAAGGSGGAQLMGIHMEGPYFNVKKKGAQAAENIIDPDMEMFERLLDAADHKIRLLDVAPELPGAMDFIEKNAARLKVSLGHTEADYDTAMEAINRGAGHITHLFNAMPAFTHRSPGVVGAAMDTNVTVELICDGFHIHPAVVRSVFKMFGAERVVLVSDAMRACGLTNGNYELGGQPVILKDGKATLSDGTLAGSATDLLQCMRNAVSFGIPVEDAVRAASFNPAQVAGAQEITGSIDTGRRADLLLVDNNLELKQVIIAGSVRS